MAFIHDKSVECASSQLDIFVVPPSQTTIDTCSYIEYHPLSSLSQGGPIEYNILGTGSEYLDLSNIQISLKARIVTHDDKILPDTAKVGPINLFLHSLFSQVDIKLNGQLVSSTNNTYSYRAYLETLLTYSRGAKQSHLAAALYSKDIAGRMDDNDPTTANANQGLKARADYFSGNAEVEMQGRLHSDIFFQDKFMLSEVNVGIRLLRNKDAFCLMGPEGTDYKVKITECKLLVRKIKLTPSAYMGHAEALQVSTAKYPIRRVVCKTFTIPARTFNWTQEGIFHGQIPNRLIITMVDNDAFNGVVTKNPYNFKHYSLKSMRIFLDGHDQNVRPIVTDFENKQYINAYQSLFSATGKLHSNEDLDITRQDFRQGYAIYAFDLTSDLNPDDNYFSLIRNGSVRCELNFGKGLEATVNVICLAEFENIIEIDRDRNIKYDYST